MYSLPKGYIKAWVKALRSDNYCQRDTYLLFDGSYCALGVAYNAVSGVPDEILEQKQRLTWDFFNDECDISYNVPRELLAGTEFSNKILDLNDDKGKDFDEIANWIEENVNDE